MRSRRARLVASYAAISRRCTFRSGDESGWARRGARRFAFGFLERVAQDDEVARTDEHFFFELVDLRGELRRYCERG